MLFQLDLPNHDIVGVKARPTKLCSEVFGPLIVCYGFRPEHVVLSVADSSMKLAANTPISVVDGQRIVVSYRDDLEEWGWDVTRNNIPVALSCTLSSTKSGQSDSSAVRSAPGNLESQSSPQQQSPAKSYHNIDQLLTNVNLPVDENGKRRMNISTILDLSNISDELPGDDTQSDSFFREIIKSAQYVPSPSQTTFGGAQISTVSAAYGIIADQTEPKKSKQLQRFNSINEPSASYDENQGSSATPQAPYRKKTSHLKELQNHRHFRSYHPSLTAPQFSPNQFPLDLNSTADEVALLKKHQPPAQVYQSTSGVHSRDAENILTTQPRSPIRRNQTDPSSVPPLPPPLPPKNAISSCVLSSTGGPPIPPPRPPPIAIGSHKPYSIYNQNSITNSDVPAPPLPASTSAQPQPPSHHQPQTTDASYV